MKQINLIPDAIQEKERGQRLITAVVLAGILGLGLSAGAWFVLRVESNQLQSKLSELQAKQDSAQRSASAQSSNNSDLVKRITQINTLEKNELSWAKVFVTIGSLIPKDISLTSYTVATGSGLPAIKVTGMAPTNVSFASFAKSLWDNKTLSNQKVEAYTYNAIDGTVTYSISMSLAPTGLTFGGKP